MTQPSMSDAFYESCFAVGSAFARASQAGATDKTLYANYKEFWHSTNTGLLLTLWCHFVETYFNSRQDFIDKISEKHDQDVVRILFYIRNAFIHCKWDISKLDPNKGQEHRIRTFIDNGYTHPTIKAFKLSLNGDIVQMEGLLNIGYTLIKEAESNP